MCPGLGSILCALTKLCEEEVLVWVFACLSYYILLTWEAVLGTQALGTLDAFAVCPTKAGVGVELP